MGAGASTYATEAAALADGKTQEEIDAWKVENPLVAEVAPAEDAAPTPAGTSTEPIAPATQVPSEEAQSSVKKPSADGIDRSEIERNAEGSEEPSSADPELWNIDNCEVDMLVKYKMGGQMWYVQSRMRENNAKSPAAPIPGFPMNQKAHDANRYYTTDEGGDINAGSTNFCDAKGWKEIQQPPVAK
jgi:hypothetical protein